MTRSTCRGSDAATPAAAAQAGPPTNRRPAQLKPDPPPRILYSRRHRWTPRRASDPPALLSFFPAAPAAPAPIKHLQPVNLDHLQQIRKSKQPVDPWPIVSYYVFCVCSFRVKHLSYDTPRQETEKGRAQALFRGRRRQKTRGHVQKRGSRRSASPAHLQEAPEAPTRDLQRVRANIIRIM